MTGAFAKLRLIMSGNFHDALDKVIDLNSASAVRQLIRDLEGAQRENLEARAQNRASLDSTQKDLDIGHRNDAVLVAQIQRLVAANQKESARPLAEKRVVLQRNLVTLQSDYDTENTRRGQLEQARSAIDAKHEEMMHALTRLESLKASTASSNRTADSLLNTVGILNSAGGVSVDSITERAKHDDRLAQARVALATESISHDTVDDVVSAEADDMLNQMSQQLAQPATT